MAPSGSSRLIPAPYSTHCDGALGKCRWATFFLVFRGWKKIFEIFSGLNFLKRLKKNQKLFFDFFSRPKKTGACHQSFQPLNEFTLRLVIKHVGDVTHWNCLATWPHVNANLIDADWPRRIANCHFQVNVRSLNDLVSQKTHFNYSKTRKKRWD